MVEVVTNQYSLKNNILRLVWVHRAYIVAIFCDHAQLLIFINIIFW